MSDTITTATICNAIANEIAEVADMGSGATQKPGELGDGIADEPTIQIYPEAHEQDPSGSTDRTTFRGGVRQTVVTVHVDLYARQRRYLGEDMAALIRLIDAITDKFEEQDTKPYFDQAGIKAFSWTGSRVLFTYGDPQVNYVGWRWTLLITVF